MSKRFSGFVMVVVLGVLSGCGGDPNALTIYEVEGTATMNGEPISDLSIELWPTGTFGEKSRGTTDAQGRFVMKIQNSETLGAVEGLHKVVIRDNTMMKVPFAGRANENVDITQGASPRIADLYSNHLSSDIEVQITGPTKDLKIEVKPYGASVE